MDAIEPDELYEERGSVTFARPILQGDVFENVVVPGLGNEPLTVQIVMHPCSMRRGSHFVERVQVAPVQEYSKVTDWDGHVRVMPLPDLRGDGKSYAARFVDKSAAPTPALTLDKRIASLSHQGIHVLQQRIVMDDTRVDIDLGVLRAHSAPILAEAEMQEAWVESRLGGSGIMDLAEVERAGAEFQAWLDQDQKKRRTELQSESNHSKLRKAVREDAVRRRAES